LFTKAQQIKIFDVIKAAASWIKIIHIDHAMERRAYQLWKHGLIKIGV